MYKAVILGLALLSTGGQAKAQTCTAWRPPDHNEVQAKRSPLAQDLIELRDIGAPWETDAAARVFDLSPDGKFIAFQMRQANLRGNDYCLGVFVLELEPGSAPTEINQGGEDILRVFSSFGFAKQVPAGISANLTPKWSPDGRSIAFLRRDKGHIQLWRWVMGEASSKPVTANLSDVDDFAWAANSASLVFTSRPGYSAAQAAIESEASKGFLFDDRFMPVAGDRPMVREPIDTVALTVDLANGRVRPATEVERALVSPPSETAVKNASLVMKGPASKMAWTMPSDPSDVTAPSRLHAGVPGKTDVTCSDPVCLGVTDVFWGTDSQSLVFLRYEGWRKSQTAIYIWHPGSPPHRVLVTDDLIMSCKPISNALICAHEAPLQPRELVRVDLVSGKLEKLFDPNPQIAGLALGAVQRLKWTNSFGIPVYGDFVLPASHQPGQRHPLVVVQYQSRGFLRGGTGDEFPIQLLAAHGFAVLSVERPETVGMSEHPKSWEEVNRLDRVDWADYRSVQSALELGVKSAVLTGAVDPTRVGLTGLSNGSATAQFSIINGNAFSAVALGTCCDEAPVVNTLDGPVLVKRMHAMGYPGLLDDGGAFWNADSIRAHATTLRLPILMQVADREYLGGLESYMALKAARQPVEMYVFPDEYHIKWEPAHREAAYTRVVDWFDFWLQGKEDPDPAKAEQYKRWEAMRAQQQANQSASPAP